MFCSTCIFIRFVGLIVSHDSKIHLKIMMESVLLSTNEHKELLRTSEATCPEALFMRSGVAMFKSNGF